MKIVSRKERYHHPKSQVISVIIIFVILIFVQVNFKGKKKYYLTDGGTVHSDKSFKLLETNNFSSYFIKGKLTAIKRKIQIHNWFWRF